LTNIEHDALTVGAYVGVDPGALGRLEFDLLRRSERLVDVPLLLFLLLFALGVRRTLRGERDESGDEQTEKKVSEASCHKKAYVGPSFSSADQQ
jgi:hypothetical protein